jgi:Flp pilus assembly protein TadD
MIELACQEPATDLPLAERPELVPAWDRRAWWVAIPLILLVIAAFAPVLGNGFVDWDDDVNYIDNPFYRGLGWAQVSWAWSTFLLGVYQPLAWIVLEAQYVAWQLDPWGYHLTSILLHAANAVVLYVLTAELLLRCRPRLDEEGRRACFLSAGLATGLFAVHPLRTEAVAWASCQPYLPCALFYMLAVLAYLRAFPENAPPSRGWLVRSFLLFAVALLFKAVAVTVPAVLLILDVYPLQRLGGGPGRWFGSPARRVWLEKIPFFGLSALFMLIAVQAKKHAPIVLPNWSFGLSPAQVAQACYGIWFYVVKTLLPVNLVAHYPVPDTLKWYAPGFLVSILATVAVSAWLFRFRRDWPGLFAAWLSYLVILSPNLGLVRFSDQIGADRYCYVPMMSGVVLGAAGLCRLRQPFLRARPVAIGIITASLAALLGLVVLTAEQCRTWRSSETLWTHALNYGPSSRAHYNLGETLHRHGKVAEAAAHYAEALRLKPDYADAYNNLGIVMGDQGNLKEAEALFREAIRFKSDDVEAHQNLCSLMTKQGRIEEALAEYQDTLRLFEEGALVARNLKNLAIIHKNVGGALLKLGRVDKAVPHFAEALWLAPDDPDSDSIWKNVLLKYGNFSDQDVSQHVLAYTLNPDDLTARRGLVDALRRPVPAASVP